MGGGIRFCSVVAGQEDKTEVVTLNLGDTVASHTSSHIVSGWTARDALSGVGFETGEDGSGIGVPGNPGTDISVNDIGLLDQRRQASKSLKPVVGFDGKVGQIVVLTVVFLPFAGRVAEFDV